MEGLDEILDALTGQLSALPTSVLTIWVAIQLAIIALAALVSWALAAYVRHHVNVLPYTVGWPALLRRWLQVGIDNLGLIICIGLLLLARIAMHAATAPNRAHLIGVAASLATAWVVISMAASLIRNAFINRVVSVVAWSVAALSIVGLLEEVIAGLDRAGIVIGGLRITALLALKTAALLLVTLWGAVLLSNFLDARLRTYADLTPSIQVLLGKLARAALITFAVLMVLGSVGIDFSALAIFSGAVGVGVGFGLQKIVSNLVSGIILLADKSIKPGDVITVGTSFGWVDTMGARYTSVVSRDGREYLIPNEDFITQRVVNWTFSNDRVRNDIKFGVSYGSDPHKVRATAIAAALSVPRVLKEPAPTCHLHDFADSAIEMKLRFWIRDPNDGLGTVRSAVMFALWDAFQREGIEFPFPQRDVSLKEPVRVVMEYADGGPATAEPPATDPPVAGPPDAGSGHPEASGQSRR
ncbi:MAG: mechanosensitive ion channel [Hyphomicrobiales bacterium]|nr:mechanosensitive ion channel [Hyphomicrobiales bacterium]